VRKGMRQVELCAELSLEIYGRAKARRLALVSFLPVPTGGEK